MHTTARTLLFIGITAAALGSATPAAADEEFYYRLGGGLPIGQGATNRASTLRLGGSLSWNTDMICGNFDIRTSVSNQLNGVSGAFQDLMGNVINSATGAVASLPALVLQRLNPALYDLIQNGVLQASEEFNLARLDCRDIVDDMEEFITAGGFGAVAKQEALRDAMSTPNADLIQEVEVIERQAGDLGIPVVGGIRKGGAGQDPLNPAQEAALGGYNGLVGRAVDDNSAVPASQCNGAKVCEIWIRPAEAGAWLTDVVGEMEIRTCQGCERIQSKPGMGLHRKYEEDWREIQVRLAPLVNATSPINETTLASIQGGEGFEISRQVIEALREEPQRDAIVDRLSGELALSRTMEKALLARRVLYAGLKEPNIANNEVMVQHIESIIAELEGEIQSMVFEIDVRDRVVSNTTVAILQRAAVRRQAPLIEEADAVRIEGGAVK